MTSQLIVM